MGCKKNLPFKNFFYIITPYLIIYTPLEIPYSSPIRDFFYPYLLFRIIEITTKNNITGNNAGSKKDNKVVISAIIKNIIPMAMAT